LDIAVDIRKGSETYGQYEAVELTGENNRMLWIPPGFLHGFLTLENDTIFAYKVSGLYHKSSEFGIIWNDPELKIDWGIAPDQIILSDKDQTLPLFKDLDSSF
jgi:dTDP-4-dehydrorhamnose 3,5-epimerase